MNISFYFDKSGEDELLLFIFICWNWPPLNLHHALLQAEVKQRLEMLDVKKNSKRSLLLFKATIV